MILEDNIADKNALGSYKHIDFFSTMKMELGSDPESASR